MNIDVEFSIWFAQFQYLDSFFSFISTRWFAAILVLLAGVYFYHIKQLKIFVFICIATSLGDLTGNILKELLSDTRPCYGYSEIFIEEGLILKECGSQSTGMPSNHAINFFLFSTLLHLTLRNKYITSIYFISSVLVALSRVFLIKHLLSQVIIGAFIGIFLGIFFYNLFYRWIKT
jgi:PAP2 superfamily.